MKSRILFSIVVVLLVSFSLFTGCGFKIPDDTKQIVLTASPTSPTIGVQPAVVDFSATVLNNSSVATNNGKDWGTSPVQPYVWKVAYYIGNQAVGLIEDYSGFNYQVKFYKPGKYLVTIELRQGFGPNGVVDTEVGTGKQVEVNVTQGSGYDAKNFTPGLIISTSTGAAVMSITEIKVIRDWSVGTVYNLPVDNASDIPQPVTGRDGNFDASINKGQEMQVNRGEIVKVPVYGNGLCDKGNLSGIYADSALVTFQSIESVGTWKVIQKSGMDFSFTNSSPSADATIICYLIFKATNNVGVSGITFPVNMTGCAAGYQGRGLFLRGIDGSVRVK